MTGPQPSATHVLRVAHFSDLHYGPRNLQEADRCFGAAIDRAVELGVDAAVISGDSTDHALDLHAPAVSALVSQVRRLADHCPVLMLQGTWSHEPPGTLTPFSKLGGRHTVQVADRVAQIGLDEDGRWHFSAERSFDRDPPRSAIALFSCLPAVSRSALAAAVGGAEAAGEIGNQVARVLRGFAVANASARARGLATLLVSHGTVFGSVNEHGVPMAGLDHEFTTGSLFDAGAQAVLLGHLHRHQRWDRDAEWGRQCIAYAGSIGRFHHGESGDKGFLLWTVGAHGADCELHVTPARRTIDIEFAGPPDTTALQAALTDQRVEGAWVRLRWTVGAEDRAVVDRRALGKLLSSAAGVQFEGRVVPVVRTRAAGVAQAVGLAAKVRAWATLVEARPEPLLGCLEALQTRTNEAIVEAVLAEPERATLEVAP